MDSVSNQLLMGGIRGSVTGQVILSDRRNWVVPTGVTSICVVAVGSGGFTVSGSTTGSGGGGGGALAYKNNILVTPGETLESIANAGLGYSGLLRGGIQLIKAVDGGGTSTSIGGAGGSALDCIGDAAFSGGSGGNGAPDSLQGGGNVS